jgi:hypothetical protein
VSGKGWIGVDLDRTLAFYDHWRGPTHIGEPIPRMLALVKTWLAQGKDVRIFTARVSCPAQHEVDLQVWGQRCWEVQQARLAIEEWCVKHLGQKLLVTNAKDYDTTEIYDDRAYQVTPNTGLIVGVCYGSEFDECDDDSY